MTAANKKLITLGRKPPFQPQICVFFHAASLDSNLVSNSGFIGGKSQQKQIEKNRKAAGYENHERVFPVVARIERSGGEGELSDQRWPAQLGNHQP